jgi:HK97 family phage portal protein
VGLFRRKSLLGGVDRGVITLASAPPVFVLHEGVLASPSTIYRENAAVRACVRFLSESSAQIPLKSYQRFGEARQPLPFDDPLATLLRQPNAEAPGSSFIRDAVADLCIFGNSYSVKIRVGDRVAALVRIPPARVTMISDNTSDATAYRVSFGGRQVDYPRSDVVHAHLFNPDDTRIGVSPLEAVRSLVAEDKAASLSRTGFWENKARNEGWLIPQESLTEDDLALIRTSITQRHAGGPNAGHVGVLPVGMTFVDGSFSPKDSEFVEARRLTLELVAATYGVPAQALSASDRNLDSSHRATYQDLLPSWLQPIEGAINADEDLTGSDGRRFVEFEIRSKLAGSFREEAEYFQAALGAKGSPGWLTVDEVRKLLNLPPLGNGQANQLGDGMLKSVKIPYRDPDTGAISRVEERYSNFAVNE